MVSPCRGFLLLPFPFLHSLSVTYSLTTKDLEDTVAKLQKELEEAKQASASTTAASPSMNSEKEAQMKKRMRELATENVDILKIY